MLRVANKDARIVLRNQPELVDGLNRRFEKKAPPGFPPFTCNEERTMTAAAETAKAPTVDMKLEV
jgi:hypothetical protein